MSDLLRTFFAIDLPADARARAAEATGRLQAVAPRGVRWMTLDSLHLTLKFLGEIPEEGIPRLIARAHAKLAMEPTFEVELAGFGAFPNGREARTVWLGVRQGASALARLARKLDAAARVVGAERERRPFEPHLTLGRTRDPLRIDLERAAATEPVAWTVSEVILYESRLPAGGARFVPLARFPLGAGIDADFAEFAPET